MTTKEKSNIRLLRIKGLSFSEIAEETGISRNAIKSFCRREKILSPEQMAEGNLCKNCGKPMVQKKGGKPRTFCTDQCRWDWWNFIRKTQQTELAHDR